ncbi:MAG TPA: bifunctional serine/threonine-protein kinase/formylglycine-generating enzyme family protein [Gemmatimonadales bacterium]|nr:bifunctional serine/threonine-protein kinase/formylglycine-generating enzyme family protein [Gemmatimonadales bacterium]
MTDPLFGQVSTALAGRYALVRELGQGGMGAVFLGKDVKLGREVAIKVLPPTTRAYLGSERFQREVQLVARLSHPHIVPLFEADEVDGFLYYVMEYVEGESLAQRLVRQGPLPFDEAIRIIAEVGDALQYAHEHGIVHRDIKPANILLSGGHARVTDFGIAKSVAESEEGKALTGTGVTVGTAAYMSPEQASGERRIDARSDVYALAAVLYEMLAGEPPFTGPNAQAIVARILVDAPRAVRTVRPNVPAHVDQALLAGLAKVPADRPPSARAFVDSLVTPTVERPTRKRLRRGWVVVGAALLVAAALLLRPRPAPPPARPPGMVLVPSGTYTVGGGSGRPTHGAALAAFYIDSTEVTVANYQRYLTSAGIVTPWRQRPPDEWPATGILWDEAQRYCAARGARLPTEDEWEAAARGPDGRRYPWGDQWVRAHANAGGANDTLMPVGGFPLGRSVVGALDMVGNAWEWVDADTTIRGQVRHVIKGGAFNSLPQIATATYRVTLPDDREQLWNTGFRCAQSVQRAKRD